MVKTVSLLGLALAVTASVASGHNFHGHHHNHRTDAKPFGPTLRSAAHHTVYETPVTVAPPAYVKRHLSASRLGSDGDQELEDNVAVAAAYLASRHDIPEHNMKLKSAYRSEHNGVTHVYFRQVVNGLEVVNGDANVNIDKYGRVISSGNSFSTQLSVPGTSPGKSVPAKLEHAIKDSWEYAQHMASSAFDRISTEVTEGLDRVAGYLEPLVGTVKDRLHIQGTNFAGENEVDFRDHSSFRKRGLKDKYLSAKDALRHLASHLKSDLLPHHLASVDVGAALNIEGDPELLLSNVPKRFAIDGKVSAQPALIRLDDGSLAETWDLTVEQDDHWWNAQVNARTGKIDSLVDWSSNYVEPEAFRVYPWRVPDPSLGERSLVENPAHKIASPQGWVSSNQTAGNNVFAQSNPDGGYGWENNFRPSSADRVFDYPLDLTKAPASYIEAAVTQLFYTNNFMHDLFYLYGFDEASGNFQDINFSGKGRGNDAVIANAQDGSGYNNANFATPPDGRHPKMRMYVWDITNPNRDGDLEQGIVVHEYTHGISIRLTGGPANSNCLGWGESGGMGEGHGDILATIIRLNSTSTRNDDIPMGFYSAARGIRKYPYSTSMKTNPSTYGIMDGPAYWEVHAKGEVWAAIYYEVLWNLIDAHGFSDDVFSHDMTKGNTLAMQLLIDAFKLQPCRPNFIDTRDAILLADRQLTGGENQCLIWKGFAKRGLGKNADLTFDSPWGGGVRTEDFSVPSACA